MTSSIDTVLFDLGKVLIGWDQARLLDFIFHQTGTPDSPAIRELFRDWQNVWDLGCMKEESAQQKAERPDLAPLIDCYCANWQLSLDPVIEGTVDILRQVKQAGYRTIAASNFATDTFEIARPRMGFLALFDEMQVSGFVGLCKPDPRFFERMIETFSLTPHQTLFIDDREENLDAARRLGIRPLLFTSTEKLGADILEAGISISRL